MLDVIDIKIKDNGYAPIKAHVNDAGIDLRTPEEVCVPKGGSVVIDTKVCVEIPRHYYGQLASKSGLHIKHGVVCLDGVIDAGFVGTIVVKLFNFGDEDYTFNAGDKIVQLLILPCETPMIQLVAEINTDTERGTNGFGSSGK